MRLAVHNRPGYFRALAWAFYFVWHSLRGRVDYKSDAQSMRWECWPKAESWVSTVSVSKFIVYAALVGARFRMDETDVVIQMEIWRGDQSALKRH
jgi:hypothetical protein